MQFIPARNTWSQIGESIAGNAASSYMDRADEMALQKAVGGLGKEATGEDIINTILNARTYSPKAKQTALQNYAGVLRSKEQDKQLQLEKERTKELRGYEEGKELNKRQFELNKEKEAREYKKKTTKELIEDERKYKEAQDKRIKEQDREQVRKIAPLLADTPEEQATLAESLTPKEAAALYKQRIKPKGETTADKIATKNNITNYYDYIAEADKLNATLGTLDEVEKLAGGIDWIDRALNLAGLSGKGKELEGISLPLIQPVLKIINPTGPVAVAKFKILEQRYKISGSDHAEVVRGKISALRKLAKQAKEINDARLAIYAQYDGNPPPAALVGVQKAIDDLVIHEADTKQSWEKGSQNKAPPPGKVRVKLKGTKTTGSITPYAGMEAKYDIIE